MSGHGRDQYVATTALLACAEALHQEVHRDPREVLRVLSWRSGACDSVLAQVGATEFHAMLCDLTDSVCRFLRDQAEQVSR